MLYISVLCNRSDQKKKQNREDKVSAFPGTVLKGFDFFNRFSSYSSLTAKKKFLFLTYLENKLKVADAKIEAGLETDLVKNKNN